MRPPFHNSTGSKTLLTIPKAFPLFNRLQKMRTRRAHRMVRRQFQTKLSLRSQEVKQGFSKSGVSLSKSHTTGRIYLKSAPLMHGAMHSKGFPTSHKTYIFSVFDNQIWYNFFCCSEYIFKKLNLSIHVLDHKKQNDIT